MEDRPALEEKPPRLTSDHVIAILLVPVLAVVIAALLSLDQIVLFVVFLFWQTTAVGFLAAYFFAGKIRQTADLPWSQKLTAANIAVGLIYTPFVFIWLFSDYNLPLLLTIFLSLLGGQAGWLLFAVFKPLVAKPKWKTPFVLIVMLIVFSLLWLYKSSTPEVHTDQAVQEQLATSIPPASLPATTLPTQANAPTAAPEMTALPTAEGLSQECDPNSSANPTLYIINSTDRTLTLTIAGANVYRTLTIPAGATQPVIANAGEYSYIATIPNPSVKPAKGKISLNRGCAITWEFSIE
jgi:hypothetical protein